MLNQMNDHADCIHFGGGVWAHADTFLSPFFGHDHPPNSSSREHEELRAVVEHLAIGDFISAGTTVAESLEHAGSEFLWVLLAHVELVAFGVDAARGVLAQMRETANAPLGWFCSAALEVYLGSPIDAAEMLRKGILQSGNSDWRLHKLLQCVEPQRAGHGHTHSWS
jgi:hypothetical protein